MKSAVDLPVIALHRERAADRDLITPRWELVEALTAVGVRTVAEGRFATPDQVRAAFAAGAHAAVVGTAITDPAALTRCLAAAVPRLTGPAAPRLTGPAAPRLTGPAAPRPTGPTGAASAGSSASLAGQH
ncbi:hypothetical protein [Micromonospora sp. Llam0]|uniref:hypothetical protein n=1 Tax=Micromonospora sp. Llam0 TaxID=2485143 RepID=UPI001F30F5A6|nr:hypothetical protein [Micromonospora sp. Llam0]